MSLRKVQSDYKHYRDIEIELLEKLSATRSEAEQALIKIEIEQDKLRAASKDVKVYTSLSEMKWYLIPAWGIKSRAFGKPNAWKHYLSNLQGARIVRTVGHTNYWTVDSSLVRVDFDNMMDVFYIYETLFLSNGRKRDDYSFYDAYNKYNLRNTGCIMYVEKRMYVGKRLKK